jgi:cytidyltransferase-like protein
MKVVVASGFFDPLHVGHIEYLEKAKLLGDKLIVLVNSNDAAIRKKGYYFMSQNERIRIIQSLRFVDEVFPALDDDNSVYMSLEQIRPDIFAKGGDRDINSLPQKEIEICKKYNIEIVAGLGEKISSSSTIVNKYGLGKNIESKWGYYNLVYDGENIKIKVLIIIPHSSINLQEYQYIDKEWILLKGSITIVNDYQILVIESNSEHVSIPIQSICQIVNNSDKDVEILEIQRTQI